jgi:acyl-CoA hydrolase
MPITCTPAEAAALVRPVDRIGFGLGPANPDAFLSALGGRDDWEDLVFGGALLVNYYDVLTKPGVSYRCGFFGPAERILLSQGQISGVGGHEDFVAGAELHTDAHSLINGVEVSRIVAALPEGSVVSTPRHHTGVVVTEFGVAELAGLTVRERAHALVDIAHPDHRAALRQATDRLGTR